ncbi:DUF2087 domain-containing protein [Pseudolysinimonas yzui]|uniref:DUF2087 domain-containing protein n=1 Tax=Pseudolysinimonas yzui TaxID=2708254 RepID=A0A8J3GP67_9MICO|nr:DUF2087 domain-containing protein [Pseudolysinimonas yzui]GHF09610.1 hypothetical protein GCM10011600_08290 [Pseudolysinimonas yzui]
MPVPDESVRRFLVRGEDTIDRYPRRQTDRRMLLQWIADRTFPPGEPALTESEVNGRLYRYSEDVAVLRRYLVDAGMLDRSSDGTAYRRILISVVE